jgi:hypothetical protein
MISGDASQEDRELIVDQFNNCICKSDVPFYLGHLSYQRIENCHFRCSHELQAWPS